MLRFEWDESKNIENQKKHGVLFDLAQHAFADPQRIISQDLAHSANEMRFYCFGKVAVGVLTVRFTYREGNARIIGAGYWRKGRKIYETENNIHKRTH
jgi:uncharacterized DUF497 family protein